VAAFDRHALAFQEIFSEGLQVLPSGVFESPGRIIPSGFFFASLICKEVIYLAAGKQSAVS